MYSQSPSSAYIHMCVVCVNVCVSVRASKWQHPLGGAKRQSRHRHIKAKLNLNVRRVTGYGKVEGKLWKEEGRVLTELCSRWNPLTTKPDRAMDEALKSFSARKNIGEPHTRPIQLENSMGFNWIDLCIITHDQLYVWCVYLTEDESVCVYVCVCAI